MKGSFEVGSYLGLVANMLDYDTVISEFELQSRYYVHFWINTFGKGMNLLILQAWSYLLPLLFFWFFPE